MSLRKFSKAGQSNLCNVVVNCGFRKVIGSVDQSSPKQRSLGTKTIHRTLLSSKRTRAWSEYDDIRISCCPGNSVYTCYIHQYIILCFGEGNCLVNINPTKQPVVRSFLAQGRKWSAAPSVAGWIRVSGSRKRNVTKSKLAPKCRILILNRNWPITNIMLPTATYFLLLPITVPLATTGCHLLPMAATCYPLLPLTATTIATTNYH